MTTVLIFLATGLAILAEGRYIVSILKRRTKPSFSGWLLFTVSMVCVFDSAYALGARDSLVLIGTFALLNAIITTLALKYGYVRFDRMDMVLLALTLVGVVLWWRFSSPWYTLVISTLIDMFGYVLMTRKLYHHPGTEDRWSWAMSVAAYGLNLVVITRWIPQEYIFSLSNVVWCGITLALAFRTGPKETPAPETTLPLSTAQPIDSPDIPR